MIDLKKPKTYLGSQKLRTDALSPSPVAWTVPFNFREGSHSVLIWDTHTNFNFSKNLDTRVLFTFKYVANTNTWLDMREKGVTVEEAQNRHLWRRHAKKVDLASAGKDEVEEKKK